MDAGVSGQLVTGVITLAAVILGGWLSSRLQHRQSRLEDESEWRNIRLVKCSEFVAAYRRYVAFLLEPSARITATPHPRHQGDMMPFFDSDGRKYKEDLEVTKTAVFMTCGTIEIKRSAQQLVRQARNLAAKRSQLDATNLPPEDFERLWSLERRFVNAVRLDLGLSPLPDSSFLEEKGPTA